MPKVPRPSADQQTSSPPTTPPVNGIDWSAVEQQCLVALAAYAAEHGLTLTQDTPAPRDGAEERFRICIPGLTFPDGVGEGQLVAIGEDSLWGARVSLQLEHNRVFAGARRDATLDRCYLNDYLWARPVQTDGPGTQAPTAAEWQLAVAGAEQARTHLSTLAKRVLEGRGTATGRRQSGTGTAVMTARQPAA